jgi:hypothetical protein
MTRALVVLWALAGLIAMAHPVMAGANDVTLTQSKFTTGGKRTSQ